MAAALDLELLPPSLRDLVARALSDVDSCEEAIDALERRLASAPGRPPELLVALALLVYHEAAERVLVQLAPAAERALGLLDEASAAGEGVERLRRLCVRSLELEHARDRALGAGGPRDAVELAHRLLLRGADHEAAPLLGE